MYEAQTYEAILSRMLQKALSINGNLDTREGSLVWCGDAPAAVELQNLYIALDTVLNETFADTATRKPRRVAVEHYTNHLAPSHEHPLFYRRTELLCFG